MPDGQIFPTIGICKTIGLKNITLLGFGIGAGAGAIVGYGIIKMKEQTEGEQPMYKKILYVVAPALGIGCISAVGAYFTCKGVEYGVPVKQM